MKKYTFDTNASDFVFAYMHGPHPEAHAHDFWEIMIVTEGVMEHRINGAKRELQKNTICLIRPQDRHSTHKVKDYGSGHVNICVREQKFKELLDIFDKSIYDELQKHLYIELKSASSMDKYVLDSVYRLQTLDKDSVYYERLLALLFFDLLRPVLQDYSPDTNVKAQHPAPVRELIEHMHDIKNITCSIEEICRLSHFSHSYLIKLFKKHLGTTPVRFFQNLKMIYASNLLETTKLSILSVAEKIGIYNAGHFNVVFKKAFGVSPSKYRKNWHMYYNSFYDVQDRP
ncbi:MAG: AraC family transcriptional regulator [Firmicutes bacterium]|nr:AraC family transcriptional regulator [Bacillota bacterium]